MHPLLTMGGLVRRAARRRAPQAINMRSRRKIYGLCITHSWAQDITQVHHTTESVHVFELQQQPCMFARACVLSVSNSVDAADGERKSKIILRLQQASLNQQDQGALWVDPNWKTTRSTIAKNFRQEDSSVLHFMPF